MGVPSILAFASAARISGCLWTLGMRPIPIALRIAFAIFRWLTGRRPVALLCFIRPIAVMYSDIIEKFCGGNSAWLATYCDFAFE